MDIKFDLLIPSRKELSHIDDEVLADLSVTMGATTSAASSATMISKLQKIKRNPTDWNTYTVKWLRQTSELCNIDPPTTTRKDDYVRLFYHLEPERVSSIMSYMEKQIQKWIARHVQATYDEKMQLDTGLKSQLDQKPHQRMAARPQLRRITEIETVPTKVAVMSGALDSDTGNSTDTTWHSTSGYDQPHSAAPESNNKSARTRKATSKTPVIIHSVERPENVVRNGSEVREIAANHKNGKQSGKTVVIDAQKSSSRRRQKGKKLLSPEPKLRTNKRTTAHTGDLPKGEAEAIQLSENNCDEDDDESGHNPRPDSSSTESDSTVYTTEPEIYVQAKRGSAKKHPSPIQVIKVTSKAKGNPLPLEEVASNTPSRRRSRSSKSPVVTQVLVPQTSRPAKQARKIVYYESEDE